jgi:hypothetical protein
MKSEIKMSQVRVALFIIGCTEPTFTEIDDGLTSMQAIVGGHIEAVPLDTYTEAGIGEGLYLICNEEGKLEELPITRRVPGDVIVGSFVVSRVDNEGDNINITTEDERLLIQWKPNVMWGSFQ